MKNLIHRGNPNVAVSLPVPDGTAAGSIVVVGGLKAIAKTAKVTQAMVNAGTNPPGVPVGEALLELPGISIVTEQTLPEATLGALIYRIAANGNLTTTASGNTLVGYALTAVGSGGGLGKLAHVCN